MSGRHSRSGASPDPWEDGTLDSLLVLVAESLGYSCRPAPGEIVMLEGPRRLPVNMRDVRQLARLVPRTDWPAVVSDYVTTIVTSMEEPLDLSDFDLAQHLLRTRIYPGEADNGGLAARPFAPGLIEVVVVDTPTSVRTLSTEEMNGWPVSGDSLFMLGRANVRADGPLQVDEQDLGDVRVSVLHGWTFYVATHLAWLEEYLTIGPYGALVIAPNRSLIVAHPLLLAEENPRARYRAAVAAATELQAQADRAYEEGPGSLSPHLYWWRAGEMTYLETRYEGDTLVLPKKFSSVLTTLAAER
ncbi:hypothetical protein D0T12_17620 [Actinomadura spongiicola]|uniref:Uncharacterized protein n=1 Tax=Actinomadura spongiicola TaxID=2303421 RepID=A0A372GG01_9ACTN|nr:hypothetical protein [Actinomadura spongiicola]RFS84003.1 hypothetical protein D0T12_17620 [Actinomadura spongiicola]